jgi:hypothetical protein
MKHVKTFENIDSPDYGYTKEIEEKIKDFDADKPKIKYYICTPDDDKPEVGNNYRFTLEEAIDEMNRLNTLYKYSFYCIFESKIKALTKEDIKLQLNMNKYNL